MHIEHWVHQKHPLRGEPLSLEWNNLLGSCSGNEGADRREIHCDHRKLDGEISLCPTDPNIEGRLRFLADGTLTTTDPSHATDLDALNLNRAVFIANRRAVLAAFQQSLKKPNIDRAKLVDIASKHVAGDDGLLLPFGAIVTYWARKKLDRDAASVRPRR